ncbi:1-acyl-sn-glycerol-3-phosphate acyltransferase [bacterium BMS3Abin03]|jgi:1-acyl-sn-glycerol-3-phosphate acyltransferase|nr:1-acyl-sn-glycerol-3-phosphate acyltransferase [bacterium BMS3Abin03]MCG6961561.1 1-acyl-sn-glycerol-3-phosphate acyltransferase [bacterium BMS3Abin03]
MITLFKLFLIVVHTIICSVFAILFSLIDRSFNLYFKLSGYFSGGILFLSGIKLKITGLDNFDHNGTYVYVANHASQYDIVTMQKSVPNRMAIIFKRELAKIPLFGWQLTLGPYIMIDRKNIESALNSIEIAKRMMKEKRVSILVFAEGTRSLTGEVQPFKRGAFRMASSVGYPIIPVSISGSNKIMPKGTFKLKSGKIHIHYGIPISTEGISSRQEEIDLMNRVREVIIENHD